MGMDQKVLFAPEKLPAWQAISQFFTDRKYSLQMRMIDGELAFPDESPSDGWRELRVGTRDGMVTLRREADGVTLVTWGNADEKMRQVWNALAWGLAHLTGGTIRGATAAEFMKTAELPAEVRS